MKRPARVKKRASFRVTVVRRKKPRKAKVLKPKRKTARRKTR